MVSRQRTPKVLISLRSSTFVIHIGKKLIVPLKNSLINLIPILIATWESNLSVKRNCQFILRKTLTVFFSTTTWSMTITNKEISSNKHKKACSTHTMRNANTEKSFPLENYFYLSMRLGYVPTRYVLRNMKKMVQKRGLKCLI